MTNYPVAVFLIFRMVQRDQLLVTWDEFVKKMLYQYAFELVVLCYELEVLMW